MVIIITYFLGAPCNKGEGSGTCVLISNCPKALDDIKNRIFPKLCGFDGNVPIVCCIKPKTVEKTPSKAGEISEASNKTLIFSFIFIKNLNVTSPYTIRSY